MQSIPVQLYVDKRNIGADFPEMFVKRGICRGNGARLEVDVTVARVQMMSPLDSQRSRIIRRLLAHMGALPENAMEFCKRWRQFPAEFMLSSVNVERFLDTGHPVPVATIKC